MANHWAKEIKDSQVLTVHATDLSGAWKGEFERSLNEFNVISKKYGLGVTLKKSSEAPTKNGKGANVSVSSLNGTAKFEYDGGEFSQKLSGGGLHGRTSLISRDDKIEQARVFLPANPKIATPKGQRNVGINVLRVILIHELFHSCGLHDSDHANEGLFQGYPQVDSGTLSSNDRIRRKPGWSKKILYMPPLMLDQGTISKIKKIWKT